MSTDDIANILIFNRQTDHTLRRTLSEYDLNITQFLVLNQLQTEGLQTVGQLRDGIAANNTATITMETRDLNTRNLVSVQTGPDARSRLLGLTGAGTMLLHNISGALKEVAV